MKTFGTKNYGKNLLSTRSAFISILVQKKLSFPKNSRTRWWFQIFFIFTPIPGEMIQFDEHIFQMGWFNHHLEKQISRLNMFSSDISKPQEARSADLNGRHSAAAKLFEEAARMMRLGFTVLDLWGLPSRSLTARPWKFMVGIRSFPFGKAHFQWRTVKLREGIASQFIATFFRRLVTPKGSDCKLLPFNQRSCGKRGSLVRESDPQNGRINQVSWICFINCPEL